MARNRTIRLCTKVVAGTGSSSPSLGAPPLLCAKSEYVLLSLKVNHGLQQQQKMYMKLFFMFLSGSYSATGATFQAVRYRDKGNKRRRVLVTSYTKPTAAKLCHGEQYTYDSTAYRPWRQQQWLSGTQYTNFDTPSKHTTKAQ